MKISFLLAYLLASILLVWSLVAQNYEFLFYAVTVFVLVILVQLGDRKVGFHPLLLWGFDLWIVLHILGGLYPINGSVLYSLVLVDLVGPPYSLFKYDQLVHAYCYFIAALLLWQLVSQTLSVKSGLLLKALIVLAAAGIGALNEVIEFIATVSVPETNVGGYENTLIDIICNFIGALLAVLLFEKLITERASIKD